jgi:hypothetical protein
MNARSEMNCCLIENIHLLEIDFSMNSQDSVVQNCFTAFSHLLADSTLRIDSLSCFMQHHSSVADSGNADYLRNGFAGNCFAGNCFADSKACFGEYFE